MPEFKPQQIEDKKPLDIKKILLIAIGVLILILLIVLIYYVVSIGNI